MRVSIKRSDLKPFLSVVLIMVSLLVIVFSKMEMRRQGYVLLKTSRLYKTKIEQRRLNEMVLAKLTRPDRIEEYAQTRLALRKANRGQIIQLAGQTIAFQH